MMTDVREAISAADLDRVRAFFEHWTPPAIAAEIKELTRVEQAVVIRVLPRQTAAAVFEFLERHTQDELLKAMGQEEVGSILNNMAPDDRTRLLEESPAEVTKQLLAVLTPEERRTALSLLGYPAGSIGRLMTPHYVAIKEDWIVTPHTGGKAVQSFLRYGFVIALVVIVLRVGFAFHQSHLQHDPAGPNGQAKTMRLAGLVAVATGFCQQPEKFGLDEATRRDATRRNARLRQSS